MYWNLVRLFFYEQSLFLNTNMGCIETNQDYLRNFLEDVLNTNMGCIETLDASFRRTRVTFLKH